MDFSHFSEQERMQVLQSLEIKQAQESMKLYLKVIHTCFNDCVQEFTTKALTTHEQKCTSTCAQKLMSYSQRAGLRYAEHEQMMQQNQGAAL